MLAHTHTRQNAVLGNRAELTNLKACDSMEMVQKS